jgi:Tfp pilus assembly PilM family ATPase
MARFLALEWDSREARVVVAQEQRGALRVEDAFSIALSVREGDSAAPSIGKSIGQALATRRLGRVETLVAVGRANIELKLFTLPPAPDDDLPDMARFQAQREFNTIGPDWPLDFLPIDSDPTQPRTVLAAVISPQQVKQIVETCKAAELTPRRLVLRPAASASLLRRRAARDGERVCLLVDVLDEEADLTVLVESKVVFMRTVRLAASLTPEERRQTLLTEIRRSLAAVHNQLGGERVERVYLCGADQDYEGLTETIDAQLKLPADRFDPFAGLDFEPALQAALPANPGRFAPLLGLLLDEADKVKPGFDFLNPTERPKPPDRRRQYAMTAAGVAAVLLLLMGGLWAFLASYDSQIADLQGEINDNNKLLQSAAVVEKRVAEIDAWVAADPGWLDELARLSENLPQGDEVMLTSLNILTTMRGPSLSFDGLGSDPAVLDAVNRRLTDEEHVVDSPDTKFDTTNPRYPLKFKTTITYPKRAAAMSPPKTRPMLIPPRTSPPARNGAGVK